MKQKLLRIAAVIGFVVIAGVCLYQIYDVLRWKDTTGGYLSSMEQLYHTDENTVDVVILGSSHVYCGIYPEVLWEEQGIAAFNMSVSAQDKSSNLYHLKELLKTQSPKVVCVDIYGITFDRHQVASNEYRNYLSMRFSPDSVKHVKSYVEKDRQQDFIARWPIIHTRYRELKENDFVQYEPSVFGLGDYITWNTYAAPEFNGLNPCTESTPFEGANLDWYNELVALSEAEGFELVFIHIPWWHVDEAQMAVNGFAEFIADKDQDFIDFTRMMGILGINDNTDWQDGEHLNANGARKVTSFLGNYLKTNIQTDLTDRRGDQRYARWEKDMEYYRQLEGMHRAQYAASEEEFLETVSQIPMTRTILSLEGLYTNSATDLYQYAALFGMDYEDYCLGGKWLYEDGKLTKICENIPGSEVIYDLNERDTLKVAYNNDFDPNNLMIDGVSYANGWAGLQIIVYDDIEKKVFVVRDLH